MKAFFSLVLIAALCGVFECYFLNDLFSTGCKADADCQAGCCLMVHSAFYGDVGKCVKYNLPGQACDASKTCACMTGYSCEASTQGSIALEPSTHIKGVCRAQNGTQGAQIAVEGGR